MSTKLFKLLTIVFYLLITFDTGHIGGQFGTFLVLGLISGGINSILALVLLLILILFVVSVFKPYKRDFYVFLFGGALLCIPVFTHNNFYPRFNKLFWITAFVFLLFYVLTLIKIKKCSLNDGI